MTGPTSGRPWTTPYVWIALLVLAGGLVLVGMLAPKFLGWALGGGVATGAALQEIARKRRQADQRHTAAVEAERAAVADLDADAQEAVQAAAERRETPPTDAGDPEARRAALDAVAARLKSGRRR